MISLIDKAVYIDGSVIEEFPKGYDIEKLIADSRTLEEMLKMGTERQHVSKENFLKKKPSKRKEHTS